ncbi:MAG: PAS domain-containing protein [Actinomycetota bacterium]
MTRATVSIDASGLFTAFDAGAEEVFGYRAGDVMGSTWPS